MGSTAPHVDRAEQWRVAVADTFARLAASPLGGDRLDGTLSGTQLGSLTAFEVGGTPQVGRLTPAAVRTEPTDMYKICMQVRGRATVHQARREVSLQPGQMAIYDTGRPYDIRFERDWSCAVLVFPRTALGLPGHLVSALMARPLELTGGPGAVLVDFVRSAVREQESIHTAAANRLGEAGLHLIAGTLTGAVLPDPEEAADAVRLQVLAYVRRHLADPDLSHARVAAQHHMAGRTLHRLFEHEPFTVTDYIRVQRLAAVHRDLSDPLLRNRAIAALAAR